MELINNYKDKESGQINSSATDSIYTLFKPHSAECCYIVGFHPEHPEYKADPWLVVTGTDNIYLFKDKKWKKYENVHIGINLFAGEVRNVSRLNF